MSLQIHRAERADRLARELGRVLATPLDDPFAAEIVGVPTQGIERWLAQRLSHQLGTTANGSDGVCAGVEFVSPRRLVGRALATVTGVDPRTDPWQPHRSVWPLLTVIDGARGQEWARLLWDYLGDRSGAPAPAGEPAAAELDPIRGGRRWSTARHLAELFGSYATSRPGMIEAWLAGHDVDGAGHPLPLDRAWQAELWRRLRTELGEPSPAERLRMACARLISEPAATDLPKRISIFGATRLSPEHQTVLSALAVHREIHLWLTHPSPTLWRRMAERLLTSPVSAGPRTTDTTTDVAGNALLAYLGRDIRELQLTLTTCQTVASDVHCPAGPSTPDDLGGAPSLLRLLQSDLADDRPTRPVDDRPLVDDHDRSIQFHSSHGPDRQVEVLRELLVGLLADDPTLEPRDVVVMCPDIETFAPLISASFGLETDDSSVEHPGHSLRVRLADRSLRQVNPLLSALSRVLALADSRMEASAVLDLCAIAPVARKFGFADDDLDRVQDLVRRSGVRWGLSAEHRDRFAMGQFAQNTWAAGLDRLLLGVTMDETGQQFIGTALPLDDVDSSDVELVGRLAECLDRIRYVISELEVRRPLTEWIGICKHTIEMLTSVSGTDSWQIAHAYKELAALTEGSDGDSQTIVSLAEVKALLADSFRGRASRANFRTGTLTMCTMMPMRSVPHRVVCLLGVDDGVFPRRNSIDGDDILTIEPWIGDRDARSEDRQLLLDAVMAAEDHFLVIYAGADARTRAARPPAVPIGALLDALEVTARSRDGRPLRELVITSHPLQPFDQVNFIPAGLDKTRQTPFSFDRGSLRGANAAARPRISPAPGFDASGLGPAQLGTTVALPDLVRFFNHPVKALLRERAGLYLSSEEEASSDEIPVSLDGLESWAVGDRLLRLHLQGVELERLAGAEWRRGSLPPRTFGRRALLPVLDEVGRLAEAGKPYLEGVRRSHDVLVELDGLTVSGTLPAIHDTFLSTVTYSRLAAKHRLQAWLELLALTATHPGTAWQAVTIGRGHRSILGPIDGGWAVRVLADLVELFRTGLSAPLPFAPRTSAEYARIRSEGKSITVLKEKLERLWSEERDQAYERFFGIGVTLAGMMAATSLQAEERGDLAEPSRFGTLARRVWHPLFGSEAYQ